MNKLECVLECNHSVRLTVGTESAQPGASAYCRFDGWQTVVTIYPFEYRMICTDCKMGRWGGQSEANIKRTVNGHNFMRGHNAFYIYDRITTSGGTPRQKAIELYLGSYLTDGATVGQTVRITPDDDTPAPF